MCLLYRTVCCILYCAECAWKTNICTLGPSPLPRRRRLSGCQEVGSHDFCISGFVARNFGRSSALLDECATASSTRTRPSHRCCWAVRDVSGDTRRPPPLVCTASALPRHAVSALSDQKPSPTDPPTTMPKPGRSGPFGLGTGKKRSMRLVFVFLGLPSDCSSGIRCPGVSCFVQSKVTVATQKRQPTKCRTYLDQAYMV